MSTVIQEPTAYLVTPPIMPAATKAQELTVTAPQGSSSAQLRSALALLQQGEATLDRLTHDKGTNPRTALQWVGAWVDRNSEGLGVLAAVTGILGGIGGLVTGLITGAECHSLLTGLEVGAAIALTGATPALTMVGIDKAAKLERQKARERKVSLAAVAPMLTEHTKATGSAKVLIGRELERWHDRMDDMQMLSPEARIALRQAAATNAMASPPDIATASVMTTLARTLEGTSPLTEHDVATLKQTILEAPPAARVELASTARTLLGESKRPIGYEAGHQLFALESDVAPTV